MTTQLSKGQNAPLVSAELLIAIAMSAPADLSALLVAENGKVRTDADFIFFNQPEGPGVNIQPGPPGQPANIAVRLEAVPRDIARVRAVITLEDTNSTFGQFEPPNVRISDNRGNLVYEYRIDGLATESIVIAVEIYRREDSWKIRAVGQGYAGGFAALVTDHGVSVDDAPATTPPPPAPQSPPPPNSGEISLMKGRVVNLTKGQRVSLQKEGNVALTRVRMGLGWDPIKRGMFSGRTASIDLDASAVLFADGNPVDTCYYRQLTSKDGSIRHQGDNLTGDGNGDDEVITVDLTRIPAYVTTVVFIVTSYRGHTFDQVSNAFCRLVDDKSGAELARYTLQGPTLRCTAMVMAKFLRVGQEWKMQAIGEGMNAKHPGEAIPQLSRFL